MIRHMFVIAWWNYSQHLIILSSKYQSWMKQTQQNEHSNKFESFLNFILGAQVDCSCSCSCSVLVQENWITCSIYFMQQKKVMRNWANRNLFLLLLSFVRVTLLLMLWMCHSIWLHVSSAWGCLALLASRSSLVKICLSQKIVDCPTRLLLRPHIVAFV